MIYAAFYANQNYIEKNLCINRDKPWMHCDGHCQLNKKLSDDDQRDAQAPVQRMASEMSVLFFAPVSFQSVIFQIADTVPLNGYYIPIAPQTFIRNVFHPPAIA